RASPLILLSFPTRRSSDLPSCGSTCAIAGGPWRGDALLFLGPRELRLRRGALIEDANLAAGRLLELHPEIQALATQQFRDFPQRDRKSTRLNSSHDQISYA